MGELDWLAVLGGTGPKYKRSTVVVAEPTTPRSHVRHTGVDAFGHPWSAGGGCWCLWCGQATLGPGPHPTPGDRCRRCNAPWPSTDSWRSSAYVPGRLDRIIRPQLGRDRRLREVCEALGLAPADYADDMHRVGREEVGDEAEWLVTMGAHAVCVALDDLFAAEARAGRVIPATWETRAWLFGVAFQAYENNLAYHGWQRRDALCKEAEGIATWGWSVTLGLHSGGPVLEVRQGGEGWTWA